MQVVLAPPDPRNPLARAVSAGFRARADRNFDAGVEDTAWSSSQLAAGRSIRLEAWKALRPVVMGKVLTVVAHE